MQSVVWIGSGWEVATHCEKEGEYRCPEKLLQKDVLTLGWVAGCVVEVDAAEGKRPERWVGGFVPDIRI